MRPRRALLFIMLGAAAGCRREPPPLPPPPGAATAPPPAPAAPAEPPPEGTPGDAYFALIAPHFDRVSIYKGPQVFLEEYGKTPERERHLLAAHWCASEISNGGFMQLFSGAAGVLAPEAVAGLQALGLAENAAIVEEAMKVFGKSYPREMARRHKLLDARQRQSKARGEANPFAALDERFFQALKRHPGGFNAVAAAYAARKT